MTYLKSDLSTPFEYKENTLLQEALNISYNKFKKDFIDRSNRNLYDNVFIYVDTKNRINNKFEIFWHVVGLGADDIQDLSIFPCNNDSCFSNCNTNCEKKNIKITENNGTLKYPCLYRATRVMWINEIIRLANEGNPNIEITEETKRTKKGNQKRLNIRYKKGIVDYVVILKKGKNVHNFITAFPIFYTNSKRKFDKLHKKTG